MPRHDTPSTSLEHLQREAKRWLKALRTGDRDARARFDAAVPDAPEDPTLRDVQHALAREYGLSGWTALRARVQASPAVRRYQQVAEAHLQSGLCHLRSDVGCFTPAAHPVSVRRRGRAMAGS